MLMYGRNEHNIVIILQLKLMNKKSEANACDIATLTIKLKKSLNCQTIEVLELK